ncbi:MAG: helix-turn-helix domain-containing protein [Bacteroidales bacterium]|nr:helix-turn-helix domain-containing protein [Bacteroidales bacterium]
MENIYSLSDKVVSQKIGERLKAARLKQNVTQQSLAEACCISLSTVKKIEAGEMGTFDCLIRVIRMLGLLEFFEPLVEEEQMSPNEYWDFVNVAKGKRRKRAGGK